MSAIISLRNISLLLDGFEVFVDLSITFPEHQATFIVGKAGSGKSSLLKMSAALIQPDHGQVYFRDKAFSQMSRAEEFEFRRFSSFVFQDAALWANQNIYNNLAWPLSVHEPGLSRVAIGRRVKEIVQRVGYDESLTIRPVDCSTGEQKVISVARALILDPQLLFMDEPTASMDEQAVDRLLSILLKLKAEAKTLIIVSHDPRLIAAVADQLCVVSFGKIVGYGSADEVSSLISGDLYSRIKLAQAKKSAIDALGGGI